jgi:hypothetical protein
MPRRNGRCASKTNSRTATLQWRARRSVGRELVRHQQPLLPIGPPPGRVRARLRPEGPSALDACAPWALASKGAAGAARAMLKKRCFSACLDLRILRVAVHVTCTCAAVIMTSSMSPSGCEWGFCGSMFWRPHARVQVAAMAVRAGRPACAAQLKGRYVWEAR